MTVGDGHQRSDPRAGDFTTTERSPGVVTDRRPG
jgi:hypothetical protein